MEKDLLKNEVEEAFLSYVVEEKCKTCTSTKKGLCCHEYNECTSMEHEYFVAGYKQFENNKENESKKKN